MSVNTDNQNEKDKKSSLRKTNKPIMEKRRRARINSCLQQLKTLVLEAMRKDSSQYSKLEKADILEMTVKHLRSMQRQQMSSAIASDPTVVNKYRSGFNECTNEVMRYLGSVQNVNEDVRSRLVSHLSSCSQTVNATTQTAQSQSQSLNIPQQQLQLSQQQTTVRLNGLDTHAINQSHVISQSINQSQTIVQPQRFIQLSPAPKTQIAGAFQIIPGNGLNGPVALYVGQINDNDCNAQTSVPVLSFQTCPVQQENVKVLSSATTLHNKENYNCTDSVKRLQYENPSTVKTLDFVRNHPIHCGPVNMNMYSEKLWRPW